LGAGVQRKFEGPLFHCQWIRLPNGVKTDKYCRTNVNFRFLSYREQPFVLARDVTQVFYVKEPDPANKEEHHIVPKGKGNFFGVQDVVDEEGYHQFNALPPFGEDITIPTIDDTEEPTYIHRDLDEAIIVS
jgi:hypothetical protein